LIRRLAVSTRGTATWCRAVFMVVRDEREEARSLLGFARCTSITGVSSYRDQPEPLRTWGLCLRTRACFIPERISKINHTIDSDLGLH